MKKLNDNYFPGYGFLDYLDPEEYFADNWGYVGTEESMAGVEWDIVSIDRGIEQEYRFTQIKPEWGEYDD